MTYFNQSDLPATNPISKPAGIGVRRIVRGSVLGAFLGALITSTAMAQQTPIECDPAVQDCSQDESRNKGKNNKNEKKKEARQERKKEARQERKNANQQDNGSSAGQAGEPAAQPANKPKRKAAENVEPVKRKKPVEASGETAPASGNTAGQEPIIQDTQSAPATIIPEPPKPRKVERKPEKQPAKQDGKKRDERKIAKPRPSADAPKPRKVAEEPVEQQIEKAEKEAIAVVPENITRNQKQALKRAEEKRREKARDRREELIGAAAVGVAVGALVPILGGKLVEDQGDRFVVERGGNYYIRKDESALFRDNASNVEIERLRGGYVRETIYRRDGSMVITIRDPGGYVVRREKVNASGRSFVLYDAFNDRPRPRRDYDRELPPIRIGIPQDQYIVEGSRYDRRSLADIFAAPTVEELPQRFTLREVRESERVRSYVRRVDIDTLTFDTDSAYVSQTQVEYLADIAGGMLDVIDEDPSAVFLVEGHTDAVGGEVYNLTLSDRRADTVARILVEAYGVPAENLVVQGYGEEYLKIDTPYDERENRRVTVRNITPLLETAQN